jgi:aminobenzoyl-glutamate utilization protein B
METNDFILSWLDDNTKVYTDIADEIWEYAEVAWKEEKSANLQIRHLREAGFKIIGEVGEIKTAFFGEHGKGKPVIGFIGEYDALPGLSQKPISRKEPVVEGGPGHGCGHNLLGTGALAAAVAVSRWLDDSGKPGTVRYYGCPAEEQISGKTFMARSGCFDDLDVAFNFHPGSINMPGKGTAVGVYSVRFAFTGKTAHAGGAPHKGRSALDAVELMNVGVNYLREHVPEKVRIHYTITDGGEVPNIVPEHAEVWYFLRAPDRKLLDEVYDRVCKTARGAAMMTETTVDIRITGGCSHVLNNHHLADLHYEMMREIGPIAYTAEELQFAEEINTAFPEGDPKGPFSRLMIPESEKPRVEGELANPIFGQNFPSMDEHEIGTGSTDVGDVSLITPLSMLSTTCSPVKAASHSWGVTAVSGMSIGHKGMMHAAKIMASTAALLVERPEHLKQAREEFERAMDGGSYISPLPADLQVADVLADV